MSRLPDFEALAMVARLAEEGSFAAAARALGVSVATVSRAVTRLEERLGGRVFNRSSRRLALTDLGRIVAERAARTLCEAEEAEAAGRELASQPRGLVRLAVPMSFGLRRVAPVLPDFLRRYPDISLDLHLGDAVVDLVGEGFDAALRIAVLEDSALVARRLCPVARLVVASPAYLARHGRPQHPRELAAHRCLGYAYRARGDAWRFIGPDGEEIAVIPTGPLRVTNVDALVPTVLDGLGIAEVPDFVVAEHLAAGRMEVVLPGWRMALGGLYFITPTARHRPAKVEALAAFLAERLSVPG
ncbi:LysR family transcriptional regulator [Belnapia sp. F-4-1]|uniref:LysR family transcriptional regulator n=1 Tax=Belnapia sp. F-4-1 TaxID=1545443 RepID=UPI0005B78AD3|nr:LysR family transcriptional regulator [Belnapia sp. F-4-1]